MPAATCFRIFGIDGEPEFSARIARIVIGIVDVDHDEVTRQASIILCMVILDHPTEWDFGYWFHNAVRLATKLDLRNTCVF